MERAAGRYADDEIAVIAATTPTVSLTQVRAGAVTMRPADSWTNEGRDNRPGLLVR